MLYKFFSRHTKQPAFKLKNMNNKITVSEWLEIASFVISEIALSIKDDGKLSMAEAMKLLSDTLLAIINAYNK